jgi:hypothetical protein
MASSTRRDPVRELALLARAPESGSRNLGEFIAENAPELAQVLDANERELMASHLLDDEEVAPRVRQFLERHRRTHDERDRDRRRQRSLEAAARLGETVRWSEVGAELDVDLLLGELLADRTYKWVAFTGCASRPVVIPRHLIAAVAPLRRVHLDLAAYIDDAGMHVRWRAGRGGYNLRPQLLRARGAKTCRFWSWVWCCSTRAGSCFPEHATSKT